MLEILPHQAVIEIRMARPPVNALNQDMIEALHAAIAKALADGAQGIVLSGAPGMYSAGVDVPALLGRDRDGVHAFWRSFFALCSTMATSPVPLVAAVTGHSPAGGAVLALFCDYRVMAAGAYKIGLNEVQVGLTVPAPMQLALRRVVGGYRAERLLVAGAMLDAEQALAQGFVDELVPPEQVIPRAHAWLEALLALPQRPMLATRTLARADLAATWSDPGCLDLDGFVDDFFRPETQAVLQELVARLKSKR